MLTITKPVQYGYRSVHDLPTPPSTSRPSPPLAYQESNHPKASSVFTHPGSPPAQPMSAPHRPLPPPMAMAPLQPMPGSQGPPVSQAPQPPPLAQQQQQQQPMAYGHLPPPPPWQQEETMRTWLIARAEEEKTRQEEEKTRQESFRLEQRRMEHDILRTSLSGGIPPPMVPVVFAGMGGGALSQAALEWAQQYMFPQAQQQQQPPPQHPPALMPPGPISPDHQRRDSQPAPAYPHYPASGGVPSTPGSGGGPPSAFVAGYPGSPRPRGQSMSAAMGSRPPHGGPSNLPSLNTNVPGNQGAPASTATSHSAASQPHQQQQQQQQQQETQSSSSLYFHHWQPPTNQGGGGGGGNSSGGGGGRGGTEQPGTPSGESPRKRKAVGPQQPAPPPSSSQRYRSPPFSQSVGLSNPPPGRRRGHSRQRSDLGSYRARGRGESFGLHREASPMHPGPAGFAASREGGGELASQQQQQQQHHAQHHPQAPPGRSGAHSVSSLLSDRPPSPRGGQFGGGPGPSSDIRHQQYGEGSRRSSPRLSEEKSRGGGSTATRANDND